MARGSANNVTENKTRTRRGTPTKEIEENKSTDSSDKKTTAIRRNNSPITKVEKKGNKKIDKFGSASTSKTGSGASKGLDTNAVSEQDVKKETSKKSQKNKTSKIVEKVERKRKAENTNAESVEETDNELQNEIVEKRISRVQNKKINFDTVDESSQESKKVTQCVASRKTRNARKVEDKNLKQNDAEAMELEEKMDISEKKEQIETFDDNSQSSTLIKSGAIRKTRSAKKVEVTIPVDPKAEKAEEKLNKKSLKADTADDSSQDSLKPIKGGSTKKTRNAKKGEDNTIVEQKDNVSVEVRDEVNLIENVQKSSVNENSGDLAKLSKSGSTRITRSAIKGEEIITSNLMNDDKSSEIKDTLVVDKEETFDVVDDSSRDSISSLKSGTTRKTRNIKKVEENTVEQKETKGKIDCNESDMQVGTVDDNSQDSAAHIKSGLTRKTRGAKKSQEIRDIKGEEAKHDQHENDVKTDTSEGSSQDSMKSIKSGPTRKTRNSKRVEENKECSDILNKEVELKSNAKAEPVMCIVEDLVQLNQSGISKKTRNAKKVEEVSILKKGLPVPLEKITKPHRNEIVESCTANDNSQDSLKVIRKNLTRRTKNGSDLEQKDSEVNEIEVVDCSEKTDSDTINRDSQDSLKAIKEDSNRKAQIGEKFAINTLSEIKGKDLIQKDFEDTKGTENRIDLKDVESDIANDNGQVLSKLIEMDSTRNAEHIEEDTLVKLKDRGLEPKVVKDKEENIEKYEEYKDNNTVLEQEENKSIDVEEGMDCSELVEFQEHRDESETLKQSENMEVEEMNIEPQKKDKAEIDDNNESEPINPSIDSLCSITKHDSKNCFETDKNLMDNTNQAKDLIVTIGGCSTENTILKKSSKHLKSQNTNPDSDKEIFIDSKNVEEKIPIEMKVQTEYSKIDSSKIMCSFEEKETELCTEAEGNLQSNNEDVQEFDIEHNQNGTEDELSNIGTIAANQENIELDTQTDASQNSIHSEINDTVLEDSESEVIKYSSLNESEIAIEKSLSADMNLDGEANFDARKIIPGEQCVSSSIKNSESEINTSTEQSNFENRNVNPGEVQESEELVITTNISANNEQININVKSACTSVAVVEEACLVINTEQCKDEVEEKASKTEALGMSFNDNIANEISNICSSEIDLKGSKTCEKIADEFAVNSSLEITLESISSDSKQQGITSEMINDTSEKVGIEMEECLFGTEEASIENDNLESSITGFANTGADKSVLSEVDSEENTSVMIEKIERVASSQHSILDNSDDRDQDCTISEILFDSEETTIDMEDCSDLTEETSILNANLDSTTSDMADSGTENSTILEIDSIGNTSALNERNKMLDRIQHSINDSSNGFDSKNQEDDTTCKKTDDIEETKIDTDECKNETEAISFKNVELESPAIDMIDNDQEHSTIYEISVGSTSAKAQMVEIIAETQDQIKGNSLANYKDLEDTTSKMIGDSNETARNIEDSKGHTQEISVKLVELKSHIMDMNDSETENSTILKIDSLDNTRTFETITETLSGIKTSSDDIVDANINKIKGSLNTHGSVEGLEKISEISAGTVISSAVESIGNISNTASENETFLEQSTNAFISDGTKEKISETNLDVKSNANKTSDVVDSGSNNDGSFTSFEDRLKDSGSVQMALEVSKEADMSTEKNEANNSNQIAQSSSFSPEKKIATDCSHEVGNYETGIKQKSMKKKKASKSIKKGGKSNKDVSMKKMETDEVGKKIITTYEVSSNIDSSKKGVKRNFTDCSDTAGTEVSLALKIKRKRVEEVDSRSVTPSTKNIQYNSSTNHPGASKSIESNTRAQNQQSSANYLSEPGPSGFTPESKRLSKKRKRPSDESAPLGQANSAAPVRMYLERFVPFLLEGLLKITYVRPDDPIQYLADWMKENKEAAYSSMNQMQSSD